MYTPLLGKIIINTRATSQADEFFQKLQSLGAEVINFPTIEIKPLKSPELESALAKIETYDWIIFTSKNGVDIFFQNKIDLKKLKNTKFATIGPKTKKSLNGYGFYPEFITSQFITESVIDAFSQIDLKGKKILLPVAKLAKKILPEKLIEFGAIVENISIYDTLMPDSKLTDFISEKLEKQEIDYVTFTSSSTVNNFFELLNGKSLPPNLKIVTIGPKTAKTVKDIFGFCPIIADEYTIDGVVMAIISDIKAGA